MGNNRVKTKGLVSDLLRFLNDFYTIGAKNGLIVHYRPPAVDGRTGEVGNFSLRDLEKPDFSLRQYLGLLEKGLYTFLLEDGALLDLTVQFDPNKPDNIKKHRYFFLPTPLTWLSRSMHHGENDDLSESSETWEDGKEVLLLLQQHALSLQARKGYDPILMAYSVRFDYDPDSNKPNHPPSHLTLFTSECRITVQRSLHPIEFLRLVFDYFWSPNSALKRGFEEVRNFLNEEYRKRYSKEFNGVQLMIEQIEQ